MCLNKKIACNGGYNGDLQITQWSKSFIILRRSAIIKKASQGEQQNQSTITTNINYIQHFMSILKKF